jgi:hypothetical protein
MRLSGELTTESGPETHNEGDGAENLGSQGEVQRCSLPSLEMGFLISNLVAQRAVHVLFRAASRSRIRLIDLQFFRSPIPVMDLPSETHALARDNNALAACEAWYSASTGAHVGREVDFSSLPTYGDASTKVCISVEGVHF